MTIKEAYDNATFKLIGHGPVTTTQLMDAMTAIGMDLEKDTYGVGTLINEFENKMARKLGTEAAVFYPSGTMAQQIALRIHCDEKGIKRVAYHPLCHLEIHEQNGIKELHGIESILLGASYRLFTLEDLQSVDQPLGAVLIELPQREIGGQLPSYDQLVELSDYCKSQDIPLHLDGARLFETLPYYKKEASEICMLFNSIYISFYKGFGGITGAILAGSKDFCETSKIWKRRHGGDLYSLYPYIISADYSYELRKDKMKSYYEGALMLADKLNQCKHILTVPEIPVSNMFHVHFDLPKEVVEMILASFYEKADMAFRMNVTSTPLGSYFECSVGDALLEVPKATLDNGMEILQQLLGQL